ncbi:aerobic-type carbon monoxide dehydrogenase small subunit (CoxS/CutS family) [Pseudoduganella flava]|uniref:2Fe-2S iron-sulfur cluster binding domain-containing protein n=1 Tax=Pseudoduganella flava TaxID=871742 RepID=A0A562P959_9BURK|nr:(2Fe-2S)-binding protein [Pseudoduganella flava]QGZ38045.1 2Fe-2S iron-sulfur cluster binding domain-containing protein [Pseudoduganella flava]TWI40982.1 aerobic-type carbon monoxide dehydrogenase small subunit (CoxS/CutS family) [Pseudoduganella flava]
MTTTITLNGRAVALRADPATPLLYVLRNELELNGAKFGCGMGQCGACTVLLDGEPVFSCITPLVAAAGRAVRTVEGLGSAERPGPLQASFIRHQAAQCGYCIAGMMMRAQALLDRVPDPTEQQVRAQLEPNLCRCGTHHRIIAAVLDAAQGARR